MSIDSKNHRTLHVLTGPTAVGKTGLALDWAEANGATIVSCDSLLVYRGMDVGTAKPTPAELARVPHRCVDVADPAGAAYSVNDYIAEARRAVDGAVAAGRPVLVAGGSGFYLKSFYAPVTDDLEIPDAVRAEVASLNAAGPEVARLRLRELEPHPPAWLDLGNPRRVAKALERRLASGRPLAELKAAFDARPGPFDDFEKKTVVLARSAESLEGRIRLRVDAMLRDGLVDEVKRLLVTELNRRSPAAVAMTGYRENARLARRRARPERTSPRSAKPSSSPPTTTRGEAAQVVRGTNFRRISGRSTSMRARRRSAYCSVEKPSTPGGFRCSIRRTPHPAHDETPAAHCRTVFRSRQRRSPDSRSGKVFAPSGPDLMLLAVNFTGKAADGDSLALLGAATIPPAATANGDIAETGVPAFVTDDFTRGNFHGMPYRLYGKPRMLDGNAAYPLVLILHGTGERGNDNETQLRHGAHDFALAKPKAFARHPCFIVVPQCPAEARWDEPELARIPRLC